MLGDKMFRDQVLYTIQNSQSTEGIIGMLPVSNNALNSSRIQRIRAKSFEMLYNEIVNISARLLQSKAVIS
jgi:hypothetical protein